MKTARTKCLSLLLTLLLAPVALFSQDKDNDQPSRGRGGRSGQPLELG